MPQYLKYQQVVNSELFEELGKIVMDCSLQSTLAEPGYKC